MTTTSEEKANENWHKDLNCKRPKHIHLSAADTNLVNRLLFVAIPVLCTPHAHFLVAIPQSHGLKKSGTAVTTRVEFHCCNVR
jgi:hypothetical protein